MTTGSTSNAESDGSAYELRVRNTFLEIYYKDDNEVNSASTRKRAHSDPGDSVTLDDLDSPVEEVVAVSRFSEALDSEAVHTDMRSSLSTTDDQKTSLADLTHTPDSLKWQRWMPLTKKSSGSGILSDSCASDSSYSSPTPKWANKRLPAKRDTGGSSHLPLSSCSKQASQHHLKSQSTSRGGSFASHSGTGSESSMSSFIIPYQGAQFKGSVSTGCPKVAMADANKLAKDRLEQAIRLIEEIPVRVDALLEKAQTDLLHELECNMQSTYGMVQQDLTKIGKGTASGGKGLKENVDKQKALENLSFIPQIVSSAFGARRQAALRVVNSKISNVVARLQNQHTSCADPGSRKAMERLPAHVKKAAVDVVEEVFQTSRSTALQQLRYAVTEIPENQRPSLGTERKMQNELMRTIPEELPHVTDAVEAITNQQVEHALASMYGRQSSVPNQALAQAFVQTQCQTKQQKAWNNGESSASHDPWKLADSSRLQGESSPYLCPEVERPFHLAQEEGEEDWKCGDPLAVQVRDAHSDSEMFPALVSSKGSLGHPHSCWRPCLYYRKGECISGKNCSFCHCVHLKRTPRFDKRHREELRKMSLQRLSEIAIPILVHKMQFVGIDLSEHCQELEQICGSSRRLRTEKANQSFHNRIRSVLESMTVPKILALVKKKADEFVCHHCRFHNRPCNCMEGVRLQRIQSILKVFESYQKSTRVSTVDRDKNHVRNLSV